MGREMDLVVTILALADDQSWGVVRVAGFSLVQPDGTDAVVCVDVTIDTLVGMS